MKTPQEQAAELARRACTITVTGPDGAELSRVEGVTGYLLGCMSVDGAMRLDGGLPPEIAAAVLEFMRARYVVAPYLSIVHEQVECQRSRIIPASRLNGIPGLPPH